MVTPGAEFCGVILHNVLVGGKRLKDSGTGLLHCSIDRGCYLASSITSHIMILKLGSISSTRLVSGA